MQIIKRSVLVFYLNDDYIPYHFRNITDSTYSASKQLFIITERDSTLSIFRQCLATTLEATTETRHIKLVSDTRKSKASS